MEQLEIYCENVQDLLRPKNKTASKLEIKTKKPSGQSGIWVPELSSHKVETYSEVCYEFFVRASADRLSSSIQMKRGTMEDICWCLRGFYMTWHEKTSIIIWTGWAQNPDIFHYIASRQSISLVLYFYQAAATSVGYLTHPSSSNV